MSRMGIAIAISVGASSGSDEQSGGGGGGGSNNIISQDGDQLTDQQDNPITEQG